MHQQHRIATALAGAFVVAFSTAALSAEVKYDPGDNVKFTYCYAHPPAIKIKSGDTVITSTRDASNDAFAPTDKTLMAKLDLTKVNPQTGPFYIEGAEPGDTLQVHLDKIELNREFGWGGAIPYFGLLGPEYKTAMITPPVAIICSPGASTRPQGGHARPAEQQDRQDRSAAASVLRHHRHRTRGQRVHQLAGSRLARRKHGLQRSRGRSDHAVPGV
jgi:hypothetical protein